MNSDHLRNILLIFDIIFLWDLPMHYANQNIELYILPKLGGDATKPPPFDKHSYDPGWYVVPAGHAAHVLCNILNKG